MESGAGYNISSLLHHHRLVLAAAVVAMISWVGSAGAYTNYTVGDSLGWYDKLLKPDVDYQKWVAGKTFSLGDFLIFNSDNNHSVVQTYNFNTYKRCDFNDAQDNDTTLWSSTDPSSGTPQPATVLIPLMKVGMNYFFSSDYDGEQCMNGQRFKINVTYGQGLPPSLLDSPGPSPGPESGDDETLPETIVPSNFNNPKDITDKDDNVKSIGTMDRGKMTVGATIFVGLSLFIL